jgi:dTDP-4-dehydrorhamnose reductase
MAFETILLTGGSGQVGSALLPLLRQRNQGVLAPTREELDLADSEAVDRYLGVHRPSMVINPAAYTQVDAAENNIKPAQRLNAELPEQLASYCKDNDAWLVHYSTDYVYPGDGDEPFTEDSPTGPLSVYGATKLKGDMAVLANCPKHLILRSSWVYSNHGHNFLNTMLRLGAERETLNVVADQIGTPTSADFLADITLQFVSRIFDGRTIDSGLYHAVPSGYISWAGFAQAIFETASRLGLDEYKVLVREISTSEYPTTARRPLNSRLNNAKLASALGCNLACLEDVLTATLQDRKDSMMPPRQRFQDETGPSVQ